MSVRHPPARQSPAKFNLFEVIKKRAEKRMRCGQCHISIFPLCSIAQARFGEVRFREQETDLERKSLTFIYITQTFSTGNSWGSICLLLVLSYSLRILGTHSNNVISLFSLNRIEFWSLWELIVYIWFFFSFFEYEAPRCLRSRLRSLIQAGGLKATVRNLALS